MRVGAQPKAESRSETGGAPCVTLLVSFAGMIRFRFRGSSGRASRNLSPPRRTPLRATPAIRPAPAGARKTSPYDLRGPVTYCPGNRVPPGGIRPLKMKRYCGTHVLMRLAIVTFALVTALSAEEQHAPASYPAMAPLDQYLIADRSAEIALARSAAPEEISKNATVLVLGKSGYETAVEGTNHFVLRGGAILDVALRQPGILEPEIARPDLL